MQYFTMFQKRNDKCFANVINHENVTRCHIGGLSGTDIRRMGIAV